MQKVVHFARPHRAFLRINVALSMCALGLASFTMASKAKEVLAFGPEDGVCANIIGSANCPDGFTDWGFNGGVANVTCHSSSAWYAFSNYGPYYNCCRYDHRVKQCYDNSNHALYYRDVEYFKDKSAGDATCIWDGTERYGYKNYRCQNT
ncbi:hypothetical protein B1R32_13119 [Abditibacterium utsteinense]|uniref:Secreted protein n=1 Tax=Abditibacterium utsteinense TaxID=1960156 RepID=A0A2S8SNZ6_9BACT|nr:hypothetical protein B1R32_13119 [Abditibacterium utsteinense]